MNQQAFEEKDTANVYSLIREMLVSNEIQPGEKILQGRLSEKIGASRTPVVKALHRLAAEGLVDNIPNRGFYAHTLNIVELFELLTIRSGLDAIVAQNIVETCTDEQAEEFEKLWLPFTQLDSPEQFALPEVKKEYMKIDRIFHEMQYALCSLDSLKKLNDSNQILNRTFTCGLVRSAYETYTEHVEICRAIKSKDPEAAFHAAYVHNSNTIKELKRFITQMKAMGLDPEKVTFSAFQSDYFSGGVSE